MLSRSSADTPTLSRRQFLASGGMLALARSLARAQTPVGMPRRRARRNLRIAVGSIPTSWDPLHVTSLEHLWLTTLLYDSVGRWNLDGAILPALGLGWTNSAFDRVLDVTLRPDAFFHDGTLLTPDDVRWTIERARNSGASVADGWRMEHVWRTESLDAHTVRIILEAPDAALAASLAAPALSVLPEGVDLHRVDGGTGPFAVHIDIGGGSLLQRNPWYWQVGRPHFEFLHLREIPDDTERSTALVTGMVDLVPDAPLLDVPMLNAEPSIQLVGGPSNHLCLLQVNLDRPALRDARLRRLLSAAIDRARLVKTATANQAEPTGLLFAPDAWAGGEVDEVRHRPADETRAELASLGIHADLRLRLLADNSDATLANTAVVLQEQLAWCGIALSIDLLDGNELEVAMRVRDYDLLASYTRPWRDPHELVRPLLASDGFGNRSGYAVPEVDGMIRGATMVADRDLRREKYTQLQERILEDTPVIVLFRPHYFDAMSRKIVDYAPLQPVTARGLLPAWGDGDD